MQYQDAGGYAVGYTEHKKDRNSTVSDVFNSPNKIDTDSISDVDHDADGNVTPHRDIEQRHRYPIPYDRNASPANIQYSM